MRAGMLFLIMYGIVAMAPVATGSHSNSGDHIERQGSATDEAGGRQISGAPFKIYLEEEVTTVEGETQSGVTADAALQTVVEAFTHMVQHRTDYARFDEALHKDALHKIIIERRVVNREGKEFLLLVAHTSRPGQVNLLINASALKQGGYLNQPEQLVPVLAREFQWVVRKADTTPKRRANIEHVDFHQVRLASNQEIPQLSGKKRESLLQDLFRTYLRTTDRYASLEGQPYYEIGTTKLIQPVHPDSTTKLYDIRVREALQIIVREPSFQEQTPKAVRSLLNGKIRNVAFANIPERDWATRTRVVPKDQVITVGEDGRTIQPATILINVYRTASPEDPYYAETEGLPMGALPAEKLARVIAGEIHNNITEKSMGGHVAQDELTAPQ
jgi:hypothetical protein